MRWKKASLPDRCGGNLTGLELRNIELTGKPLQLLKQAVPTITRVVLANLTLAGHERVPGNIEPKARAPVVQLHRMAAGAPEACEGALAAIAQECRGPHDSRVDPL